MLLISDANILIDMSAGGLLEAMFRYESDFGVPDVLFAEELKDRHPELPDLGLRLLEVAPEGVAAAFEISEKLKGSRSPGVMDLLALMLAIQEASPLLTGDKRLREFAEAELPHVEVRGTLWLVEQLVSTEIITVDDAFSAYESMLDNGSRLPKPDIEAQLKRLGYG